MLARIKLRYILFITFIFISSVPVFLLGGWVQQTALDKEVDAVKEKHLLIAHNLTGDLTRYVIDVESSFRLVSHNLAKNNMVDGFPEHIDSLYFRHISIINNDGKIIRTITKSQAPLTQILPANLDKLNLIMDKAALEPDIVFYSDMMRNFNGEATIYLIQAMKDGVFAIGSLSTKHIREVQQKVSFGKLGHAVIVDKTGHAIAHPKAGWVDIMKDMSFIPPVKSMMQGKTGVSRFYSTAMKADMIAGYTFVPIVGWGVMVPQPFSELEKRAEQIRQVAVFVAFLGIGIAGLIGWFLAGMLSRPIQSVVKSTKFNDENDRLSKVSTQYRFIPYEFIELLISFNRMVDVIRVKTAKIQVTSNRLSEAQRIAHVGNWEWNIHQDTVWCSEEFYRVCDILPTNFKGTYESILDLVHPDDKELLVHAINETQRSGKSFSLHHRIVLANNRECYLQHEGELHVDNDGSNPTIVGTIHDITASKNYEIELLHKATYDSLTDLPNRTLMIDRLAQEIRTSSRKKQKIGLLSIDLDDFKIVNDTYGHVVGDKLLQEAALRIQSCIRESDTLSRLGGDEFCVILCDIKDDSDCSIVAEKIISRITKSFLLDGYESFVGASLGISIYPHDSTDPNTLIRNSDIALYRVKETGKNNFCFYREEMDKEVKNRMGLINDLRKALVRDEFVLYYQPIIDLKTGRISSAEALIRWIQPVRGFVFPEEFISLSEQTGLIGPIGEWVMKTACENALTWADYVNVPPKVSVNLSVRQLKLGLTKERVEKIVSKSGLDAGQLILEITESLVMNDTDEVIAWMQSLRDIGISFSVDDFGTGYSSLSYLKKLPVNVLKIDREFIIDVINKEEDASLVKTIIAIGRSFGLKIVAEGVEDEFQLNYLKSQDCDFIQGYYYSKPLPADEFIKFLSDWDARINASIINKAQKD